MGSFNPIELVGGTKAATCIVTLSIILACKIFEYNLSDAELTTMTATVLGFFTANSANTIWHKNTDATDAPR